MTGITIKKGEWMEMGAALAASCLLMSCGGVPAYANVDPTWEEEETVIPEEPAEEASPDETVPEAPESEPEQGFTTPGNGDLGDEVTNSSGKDFYTIRTKNNNTFYMVIDHSNSTENVYMLSLIDENDLAEFMDQTEKETEAEVTPAVIIPETPAPVETEAPKQPETEVEEPEKTSPLQNSNLLILGAGALVFALLYYFKIYKPGHEEEEGDDEGIEISDGLDTERED